MNLTGFIILCTLALSAHRIGAQLQCDQTGERVDFDLLLVIGGISSGSTNLVEVELVTLDPENNPVPPCLGNLRELPVGRYAAAGAVDEEGNPFICGGNFFDGSEIVYNDECYKYDTQRDSWEQHGTMPYKKGWIADTEVSGLGLVMVGGHGKVGDSVGGEVTATKDGISFQELDQLPGRTYGGRDNSDAGICS